MFVKQEIRSFLWKYKGYQPRFSRHFPHKRLALAVGDFISLRPSILSMKFYNILIRYRLQIGILLIVIGIIANVFGSFWPAFPAYLVGVILIAGHFFFGPLRVIQEYMEAGDMEGAEKVMNSIKFPHLLYKPIRSVYYTLRGNVAMMKQDLGY